MAGKTVRDHAREVRETIVKSSLAGVGVTVLAVTLCSQAGLAGLIGTSAASAMGGAGANDPYAKLPPFPTLLTQGEVSDIRGQLASVAAAMEITRAATDEKIAYVHELAEHPGALSVTAPHRFAKSMPVAVVSPPAPVAHVLSLAPRMMTPAAAPMTLRGTEPASVAASVPAAPTAAAPAPIEADASAPSVAIDGAVFTPTRAVTGSHLELAALFFGDDD